MVDSIHFKKIWYFLLIGYLYLVHRLKGRYLELRSVSEPQAFLFGNSYFTLYIEAYGCHQISINNRIILPGNITVIRLDACQFSGSLILCFQGYRQSIVKTYPLSSILLQTTQLSEVLLEKPELQIGKPSLPKGLHVVQLPVLNLPGAIYARNDSIAFKVRIPLMQIQHEPCQLPQYNP